MSYTLGLLFEYHRYRHDAIVRVYADNRLVDELSLSSDINIKCTNNVGRPGHSFIGPANKISVMFTPKKLFLFEVDERHLHDRIRIEVQNDHTNHTNGFMTKFSYVKFHDIFLVPNCLLEYKNWQRLPLQTVHGTSHHFASSKSFPHTPHNEISLDHIMGGSFSMNIPLSRKHGVTHLGRLSPGKIVVNDRFLDVLWAFGQLNTST